MQTLRPAPVLLLRRIPFSLTSFYRISLFLLLCAIPATAKPPKVHSVTLGPARRVPYTPPEANPDNKSEEATSLHIRGLYVDGIQKEWTVGEVHDVTDRTFVIRRALHINDSLPAEAPRWTWQPAGSPDPAITFTPAQFSPDAFTVFTNLPGNYVLAVRQPPRSG